jgi:hypothetical protein
MVRDTGIHFDAGQNALSALERLDVGERVRDLIGVELDARHCVLPAPKTTVGNFVPAAPPSSVMNWRRFTR